MSAFIISTETRKINNNLIVSGLGGGRSGFKDFAARLNRSDNLGITWPWIVQHQLSLNRQSIVVFLLFVFLSLSLLFHYSVFVLSNLTNKAERILSMSIWSFHYNIQYFCVIGALVCNGLLKSNYPFIQQLLWLYLYSETIVLEF